MPEVWMCPYINSADKCTWLLTCALICRIDVWMIFSMFWSSTAQLHFFNYSLWASQPDSHFFWGPRLCRKGRTSSHLCRTIQSWRTGQTPLKKRRSSRCTISLVLVNSERSFPFSHCILAHYTSDSCDGDKESSVSSCIVSWLKADVWSEPSSFVDCLNTSYELSGLIMMKRSVYNRSQIKEVKSRNAWN